MATHIKYIFSIFTATILCACGQQRKITNNDISQTIQTDSAKKIDQYLHWAKKIEYMGRRDYNFSLSSLERNRDTALLLNFLIANYDKVKPFEGFSYLPKDLVKSTYAIDFNNDGLLDFIYEGPLLNGSITQFFLNKGNHYEKIFSGEQFIVNAKFSDNKLTSFTLLNPGCCADPQIVEYYYSVKYSENELSFILDNAIGHFVSTEEPQKILPTVQQFSVMSEKAKLRSDCYFLDNVEYPAYVYGKNGNAIATYTKGSRGNVLGLKKDNDIEWIFVLMNADNQIEDCDFPTFLKQPTQIKGWMLKTDTDWK